LSGLSLPAIVMASITLFVGAGHLSIYLRRKRHRTDLTFALLCFFFGAYDILAAGAASAGSPEELTQWLRLLFLSLFVGCTGFVWFVSDYAGGGGRKAAFLISLAYLPPLVAAIFHIRGLMWSGEPTWTMVDLPLGLTVRQHVFFPGPILVYMILPSVSAAVYSFLLGLRLLRGSDRQRGRFLIAATCIFLIGGLSDAAVMVGLYEFIFVFKFGFLAFILLMTWSLTRALLDASDVRAALTKSEERLELALEGANDGLWDWSPPTGEVHFSPRWFAMLGYQPDELPQSFETWAGLLHPEDRPGTESFVTDFIDSGDEFFSIEFRMEAKGGGWKWILSRGKAVLRDEEGHVSRMVGTHADITPMKAAETALAESEERFRSIVQSSPMGMLLYELGPDDGLILVDSNDAADRFTGTSTEALRGKRLEDAFPGLAETQIPDIYRRVARGGTPWAIHDLQYGEGEVRGAFDVHAFRTSPGRMAVLFLEVTDRLRAEQALKRSEAMYRSYFRLGLIGMAITSDEREWVETNPRIAELLGYSTEELRKRTWDDLSHLDDVAADRRAFRSMVNGDIDEYSMEKRFLRSDGNIVYTDLSVTCVRRDDGSTEFAIAHLQDITERKQAEEWLRQSQKMEAVGQLAGGVAHDFNNLLQAIQGYTDVALTQIPGEHAARDNLSEVKRAAERAATLTRQLLTFSRQETLQPAHLDLNDVSADLVKMLRRVIGEHVDLVVSAQPGLRPIFADPGQIEQVILNLCINARDAMPGGGRLSIETENAVFEPEFIREHPWATEPEYVHLRISDTGVGIPPEIRDRIFEPFYTTKEIGQGTGLGLATVYAIAQRHDAGIEVDSEPGHGASFSFYFPVRGVPPEQVDPESEETVPEGGTETILMAEDDEAVRSLVVSLLSGAGYVLHVATNGEEAIRIFGERSEEIDLVLVDVIMPKKGGREVHAAVKALRPFVPVLFTTGYSFNAHSKQRLPESTGQIIRKPYAPNELLRRVRDALDGTGR